MEYFYTIKPIMKKVNKKEFEEFIKNYPRKLLYNCHRVCTPPAISYNDVELANRYPHSRIANTWAYSDDPDHYYYEENPEYYIMENYREVFDSKTGNKVKDNE